MQDDKEVLQTEMPRLVEEWGITSCKLFMTYESMRLRDSELLDVMLEARRNGIMTASVSRRLSIVSDDEVRVWLIFWLR